MSLTSQIKGGTVGRWAAVRFHGARELVGQVQAVAAEAGRPVRPTGQVDRDHWAQVGGVFGARLAAFVEPAPPYGSFLGAQRLGAVRPAWAQGQAGAYPTHQDHPEAHERGLELRPSPSGWLDLGGIPPTGGPIGSAEVVLGEFLARARAFHAQHAPTGSIGTPGAEAVLARVYWVVSALEDYYRGGSMDAQVMELLVGPRAASSVEELLAAAPDHVVAEVVELVRRAHVSGSLATLQQAAGLPPAGSALGHASPVFVHQWADGDLIVSDGATSTLLDVKTVIRVDDIDRVARWLWQVAGYVALDRADRWRIRTVGLYLARHGAIVTWPVEDLLAGMAGVDHAGVAKVRRDLHDVARAAAAHEGAYIFPLEP